MGRADRSHPIEWLPQPVKLLPGAGPRVVGVSEDTVLGKQILNQSARAGQTKHRGCHRERW